MDDEKLIELVKQHPILFDTGHGLYMNVPLKQQIWTEIAEALNSDVAFCKTRWNNIRDNYRKCWRKAEQPELYGYKRGRAYKYAASLQFLNQYFDKKDLKQEQEDTIDGATGNEDRGSWAGEDQDPGGIIEFGQGFTLQPVQSFCSIVDDSQEDSGEIDPMRSRPIRLATRRRLKRLQPRESPSATVMKYLIDKNERAAEATANPVDAFLAGIAPALKSLSPYNWHLAKSELFGVVQKYEFQSMMKQESVEEQVPHSAARGSVSSSPVPSAGSSKAEM